MATADYPRDAVPFRPDSADDQNKAVATLRGSLDRLAARRNARQMMTSLARSLAIGTGLSALLVLAHRAYIIDLPLWLPLAIVALAFFAGCIDGARRRIGPFDAALDADRVLGLRERLSSAIAFSQPELLQRASGANTQGTQVKVPKAKAPKNGAAPRMPARLAASINALRSSHRGYETTAHATSTLLVPALVQDAARRAHALDPKAVYPARLDRSFLILIAMTLALLAFSLMPDMAFLRTPEQRTQAKRLAAQGRELEAVAKPVLDKKEAAEDAQAKKLAQRLSALGRKMQRGRMTKRQALVSMGQLRRDLDKAVQNDNQGGAVSNLEQVERALREDAMQSPEGQQVQQDLAKGDRERAADKLEALADKMDKGEMSAKEREAAANDLQKAAKALREAGNETAADKLDQAAKNLRSQQGGQQGQQKQGQGKQGSQNQQGQGGQKQGKQGQQNGQGQQGQQGQKQGQQGKSGSQSGQQGQQGGQQGGQKNGGQSGQSGAQGQQNGQGQNGQSNSQNGSGGSGALRDLAKGLRGGGTMGNSQGMRDMLKKIEQAEKDTGQNTGQQGDGKSGGKKGAGQGNGQSGQQGQGMTPGKDLQPTDPTKGTGGGAGLGPRNNVQGNQGAGGGVSRMKTNRTGDKRRWADDWSDRLPKTRKKLDRVTGKMGSSGEVEQLPTRTEAKGGQVNTPYYDVYENSRKDAEDAVSREVVPPAYKQPVKDYFDSLKPDKQ